MTGSPGTAVTWGDTTGGIQDVGKQVGAHSILPQHMALHGGRLDVDVKLVEMLWLGLHATEELPQRPLQFHTIADHEPRVDVRTRMRTGPPQRCLQLDDEAWYRGWNDYVIGVGTTALADHVAHFRPFGELDLKFVASEDLRVADSAVDGFDELIQIPAQSRWRQRADIEEFVHVAAEQREHPQLGRKLEIRHGSRYDQCRCDGRHGARNLQCRMVLMTTRGVEVGLQEYDRRRHGSLTLHDWQI